MIKVSRQDFRRAEKLDENPDLSYLGRYTNKPKDDYVIDRKTGQLLGPTVVEEHKFEIVRDKRLSNYELGDYLLNVPPQHIPWLDEVGDPDNGDLDYFEEDDTDMLTVVWTHPEILADNLSTMNSCHRYFESCNHRKPGNPASWFPHVTKRELNAAFKKADFWKHGISPKLDKHPKEFWLDIFYFCEDYERMEDYDRSAWYCVGISAEVEIKIPNGNGYIVHNVRSPGIWGIESDSDEEFKDETFEGECNILADMLRQMGMRVVK